MLDLDVTVEWPNQLTLQIGDDSQLRITVRTDNDEGTDGGMLRLRFPDGLEALRLMSDELARWERTHPPPPIITAELPDGTDALAALTERERIWRQAAGG